MYGDVGVHCCPLSSTGIQCLCGGADLARTSSSSFSLRSSHVFVDARCSNRLILGCGAFFFGRLCGISSSLNITTRSAVPGLCVCVSLPSSEFLRAR